MHIDYPFGATPLDADELASLIPRHITTQGELNEWEQLNIVQGEQWARKQRKEILNEGFLRQLHKQMFGETWKWAGEFRKSDKNIGIDWPRISVELRKLLDDVHYRIEHASNAPLLAFAGQSHEASTPSPSRGGLGWGWGKLAVIHPQNARFLPHPPPGLPLEGGGGAVSCIHAIALLAFARS